MELPPWPLYFRIFEKKKNKKKYQKIVWFSRLKCHVVWVLSEHTLSLIQNQMENFPPVHVLRRKKEVI